MSVVDRTLTGEELLSAAAAEVTSWPSVSASRSRQVTWVAGEYSRALKCPEHPLADEDATARELFAARNVQQYLRLGREGALRARGLHRPRKSTDSSEQIRLEILRMLVKACEAEDFAELPPQPDPPRKKPVAKLQRSLLRHQLEAATDAPGVSTGQRRMLAIGAIVCDTGVRAGEMCAIRIEDLSPALEELRVVRRPQGASQADAYTELLALSGLSKAALQRWLPERQALLAAVTGTATALWVSVHGNHISGKSTPPGTPLQPRGLARAWSKTVAETNNQKSGQMSWEPLPTRMEQLRRGVTPQARPAPMRPDAEKAAALLDDVACAARTLAAARAAQEDAADARFAVRQAVREAWAEGIEHTVQLSVLAEAGLRDTAALAAGGWEPALLAAVDRAAGHGRPSRAAVRS